jgi:Cdc6-like AAA superfamily ATPase
MGQELNVQLSLEVSRVFTPAAPVSEGDLFAGRSAQLATLAEAVGQPGQHAIVYGERGVGKTSLANIFSLVLRSQANALCPRVNCEQRDDFSSVFRKIFSEILLRDTKQGIGFVAEPEHAYRTVADDLGEKITPQVARQVLANLGRSQTLAVIIDEFDRLPEGVAAEFSDFVKTLSDHVVPATLVFVGVAQSVDELVSGHQSVERALVQVPMPRMSAAEIGEIIRRGLDRLALSADPEVFIRVADLAQGLPHYAHLLGLHGVRVAIEGAVKHLTHGILSSAVQRAVGNAQHSVRTSYTQATRSPRPDSLFREVLLSCALAETDDLGYFAPSAVRSPMSAVMGKTYAIASFARHLVEFTQPERGEMLERTGSERRYRYRFRNPLLPPFIVMRGIAEDVISQAEVIRLRGTTVNAAAT